VLALLVRLGHVRPGGRALALLPDAVELFQRIDAGHTALDEKARHRRAGTADAGATVHVDRLAHAHRLIDAHLNIGHVLATRGYVVILLRLAYVLAGGGQRVMERSDLIRLREIDEAATPRVDQLLQPLLRLFARCPAGVLTGEQLAGHSPIGMGQRRNRRWSG